MESSKKEVGVIGLGKFGLEAALTLTRLGHRVVAVDQDAARVQRVSQDLAAVYQGDATDQGLLEQLRFQDFDLVIVSIGESMEASILISLNLIDLHVKRLIVKATGPQHSQVLQRLGVQQVVQPEMETARRLGHQIHSPGLLDFLSLGGGTILQQVVVKKWNGRTLADLKLPSERGVMAVAEKRPADADFRFVPDPRRPLEAGDQLLLIGPARKMLEIEA